MKWVMGVIVTFLIASASWLQAEEVAVPVGQQGQMASIPTPASGMTKAAVEAEFGNPLEKSTAVGEPPISKWIYDQYTVYFESDRVVHSVKHPK